MPEKPTYEELLLKVKELEEKVEYLPVLICSFSPDFEITFINKAYSDYFEQTPEELIGLRFIELIPKSQQREVINNLKSLTADKPAMSYEHTVIKTNGEIRWMRWTNRGVFDSLDPNRIINYQSVGEDITERKQAEKAHKQAEQALQNSESVLERTGEMARVGGWELDPTTNEVTWTRETYRIHEVPFDEKPLLERAAPKRPQKSKIDK